MAAEALSDLAITSPALYLNTSPATGTTELSRLYHQCAVAGLVSSSPTDDPAQQLYGLFNIAIEHGLGALLLDYLSQVSFATRPLISTPTPTLHHLATPQCIVQWLQSSLAAVRHDMHAALTSQPLSALSSSHLIPRNVAKLRTLVLVAESLALHAKGSLLSSSTTRATTTTTTTGIALVESLVEESHRLLQAGQVMQWLSGEGLPSATQPCGRFKSQESWARTLELRRSGAAASQHDSTTQKIGLFLDELLGNLTSHAGMEVPPPYPPPSPENLIVSLFFSGGSGSGSGATSQEALYAKLAVLSYYLVDSDFFRAGELPEQLHRLFHVPRATTLTWLVLLMLDDAQMKPVSDNHERNESLKQAANFLPALGGTDLPFRALEIFQQRGRGDLALALLRQSLSSGSDGGGGGSGNTRAVAALRILLDNGLLVEAFMDMKRRLSTTSNNSNSSTSTAAVVALLEWAAGQQALHCAIRLPFSHHTQAEESTLTNWLAETTATIPQCALLLCLYYLIRGRTPEALLAYAQHCEALPGSNPELREGCVRVEELLRAAAKMMPAAQRALVVGTTHGGAVCIRTSTSTDVEVERGEGVALVSVLPGLDAGGLPSVVTAAPVPSQAPLVGSVFVSTAAASNATARKWKAGGGDGRSGMFDKNTATTAGAGATTEKITKPVLFGDGAGSVQEPLARGSGAGGVLFGGEATTKYAYTRTPGSRHRRHHHHQLDALLGLHVGGGGGSGGDGTGAAGAATGSGQPTMMRSRLR